MTRTDLPHGWTWEGVLDRLEEHVDLESGARTHGAIRRVRVIRSGTQLLRLVLAYCLSGFSLRTTAAWAEETGTASFSDVALLKRLRRCGPWLAELVGTLGTAANPEGVGGEDGRRIVAVDATMVASPGGKHKLYRTLHTVYDVGMQRFRTSVVTDRHHPEQLYIGAVEPGEIRLGDRAYGRYTDLATVQAAEADYVVRLSAKALKLKTADGTRFDRAAAARRAESAGRTLDVPVSVEGDKDDKPLAARVILLPLPPEAAEAARRQMRKKARKWGYTPSKEALATAGCVMLITSLGAKDWPPARVLALYRRRWQVELAFKRLKSLLGLERLRAFDADLVNAWIHAVLIVALLIELERPSAQTGAPDSPPADPGPSPSGAISTSAPAA